MSYSQENKTVFITGATSGIGKETALSLANLGAKVVATSRNEAKGQQLLDDYKMRFPSGKGSIELVECDFSSLVSIVSTCEKVKTTYPVIDTLINNAGVWKTSFTETKDKIEETWQVNVLAPILITHLLLENVKKSDDAKIIFTASGLHKGIIDLENPEMRDNFSGMKAYAQSKLGDILFIRWLAKKFPDNSIGTYSYHPGFVKTDIGRDMGWFVGIMFNLMAMSSAKGAQTPIFLATEPKENLVSGEYYYKQKVKKATAESNDMDMAEAMVQVAEKYLKKYTDAHSEVFGAFL